MSGARENGERRATRGEHEGGTDVDAGAARDALHVTRFETPWGAMTLASTARGLLACSLPGRDDGHVLRHAATHARDAEGRALPRVDGEGRNAPAVRALRAWLAGERRDLDAGLAYDLRGTAFRRDVWRALCDVPFGATVTYGELARRAGHADAVRAVGGACGANPLPLFVPCHRVVAAGGMGGFAGGRALKTRLLELERGVQRPGLFG